MGTESSEKRPEKNPEKLKEEYLARVKYYSKGFEAFFINMTALMDQYLNYTPEQKIIAKQKGVDYKKDIPQALQLLVDLYDAIPLEELVGHPDEDLLTKMKKIAPLIKREGEVILKGGKKTMENFLRLVHEMDKYGKEFRVRLKKTQAELRKYPGYEKFGPPTTDLKGELWPSLPL